MTETLNEGELAVADVVAFLRRHPAFFEEQPHLLKQLHLLHDSGEAISLMERQNQILRQENRQLIDRLNHFIQVAQRNDSLFQSLQRLVLELIPETTLNDLLKRLQQGLHDYFDVHETAVVLCHQPYQDGDHWLRVDSDTLAEHFPTLMHEGKALCGPFNETKRSFLFAGADVHSIALAPLTEDKAIVGLLALGHRSKEHFRSGTDTLFLTHLARITSLLVQRLPTR